MYDCEWKNLVEPERSFFFCIYMNVRKICAAAAAETTEEKIIKHKITL